MPHNKRRPMQHIMEEQSSLIIRKKLPEEWVLHQYAPDYGIDFVVETFEYINEEHTIAETLGEFFFVQLKSVQAAKVEKISVKDRYNVEKSYECENGTSAEMEVIKYSIEINEIYTVMSMGTAVPTVLLLVDLSTEDVYFLCLNDYIEKILLPDRKKLQNKAAVAIYIPKGNQIDRPECQTHLSFLARRSKLFGAFNKFNYQRKELFYDDSPALILHFISIIKEYDFWETKVKWPAMEGMYTKLLEIEAFLQATDETRKSILQKSGIPDEFGDDDPGDMLETYIKLFALPFWDKLCNLGNIYEEICKEWFLPTFFWDTYIS